MDLKELKKLKKEFESEMEEGSCELWFLKGKIELIEYLEELNENE
jgi:hypothetical protein